MKKTLFLICACTVLFAVAVLCIAYSDKVKFIDLNRNSLSSETWLEVEKNEMVKICIDAKVRAWETSLDKEILDESCLKIRIPMLIGVNAINVKFFDDDSTYKINLAVGMKYLDFKNEEVVLGYDDYEDTSDVKIKTKLEDYFKNVNVKRFVSVSGTYLVDKYPVTNCEILQVAWHHIHSNSQCSSISLDAFSNRKKTQKRNERCIIHDTAAIHVDLFLALNYANERSIRERLKPYYSFSLIKKGSKKDLPNVIGYTDFNCNPYWISIDTTSDGYRLPYHDEWMMLARGGDRKKAPWSDSTSFFKYMISKRARSYVFISEPVGLYTPNGYGLHDIFGLVEELVIFEQTSRIKEKCVWSGLLRGETKFYNCPSCLKGGGSLDDDWQNINYGKYSYGREGGFRLIRNIGNNVKWSEVKSDKK